MTSIARSTRGLIAAVVLAALSLAPGLPAQNAVATPEQFFGFRIGTDNKLARWDKIVDYMKLVAANVATASASASSARPATTIRSSRSKSARPTR